MGARNKRYRELEESRTGRTMQIATGELHKSKAETIATLKMATSIDRGKISLEVIQRSWLGGALQAHTYEKGLGF